MKNTYDVFLFDLYGTLVDIRTDEVDPSFWRACFEQMDKTEEVPDPEALRKQYLSLVSAEEKRVRQLRGPCAEIDLAVVFRQLLRNAGKPSDFRAVQGFAAFFRAASTQRLRLYPGAKALLYAIHRAGKPVFLLSNAQSLFTRPELDRLGLTPLFDGILLSGEAGWKKPDPRFYRALLDRHELDPSRTVMIGNDDEADCRGAAAAGLDSCFLRTEQSPRHTPRLPENCRSLQSLTDVMALIG